MLGGPGILDDPCFVDEEAETEGPLDLCSICFQEFSGTREDRDLSIISLGPSSPQREIGESRVGSHHRGLKQTVSQKTEVLSEE